MNSKILILGYGAVGKATAQLLHEKGHEVTVAQRSLPQELPTGIHFKSCDVLNAKSVDECLIGFDQLVIAIGFEYKIETWRAHWPVTMKNLIESSLKHGLRVVFVDNLYMYGPQSVPLHEELPLTEHSGKPLVRAEITKIWLEAVNNRHLRFTSLRAPDFFGPNVLLSHLGDIVFGNLSKGKSAQLLVPIDQLHDFAYVPDIARAVENLLNAPDSDFGQVWHMPCASTMTIRQLLELGAKSLGVQLKVIEFPLWALRLLGFFMPLAKEIWEMRFQWDRAYRVDAQKFTGRFSFTPTPFVESIPATARSFKN